MSHDPSFYFPLVLTISSMIFRLHLIIICFYALSVNLFYELTRTCKTWLDKNKVFYILWKNICVFLLEAFYLYFCWYENRLNIELIFFSGKMGLVMQTLIQKGLNLKKLLRQYFTKITCTVVIYLMKLRVSCKKEIKNLRWRID